MINLKWKVLYICREPCQSSYLETKGNNNTCFLIFFDQFFPHFNCNPPEAFSYVIFVKDLVQ